MLVSTARPCPQDSWAGCVVLPRRRTVERPCPDHERLTDRHQQNVTFREVDPAEYAAVDTAYQEKYGRYTTIVEHVLTDRARNSTLRLEPR
ncbi:DUF2255 family protein [Streptomyces sp. NPDC004393]